MVRTQANVDQYRIGEQVYNSYKTLVDRAVRVVAISFCNQDLRNE